jgi:hypothetical protein
MTKKQRTELMAKMLPKETGAAAVSVIAAVILEGFNLDNEKHVAEIAARCKKYKAAGAASWKQTKLAYACLKKTGTERERNAILENFLLNPRLILDAVRPRNITKKIWVNKTNPAIWEKAEYKPLKNSPESVLSAGGNETGESIPQAENNGLNGQETGNFDVFGV